MTFANIDANAWHISDPAIGAGSQKSVRRVRLARLRLGLRSSIYIYSYICALTLQPRLRSITATPHCQNSVMHDVITDTGHSLVTATKLSLTLCSPWSLDTQSAVLCTSVHASVYPICHTRPAESKTHRTMDRSTYRQQSPGAQTAGSEDRSSPAVPWSPRTTQRVRPATQHAQRAPWCRAAIARLRRSADGTGGPVCGLERAHRVRCEEASTASRRPVHSWATTRSSLAAAGPTKHLGRHRHRLVSA